MATTLYYSPHDDDTEHRHAVTVDGDYDLSDDTWSDSLAEQCAKDWHSNCDGWEGEWPRVFSLYGEKTGPAFARFQVDREYEPSFSATAVSKPPNGPHQRETTVPTKPASATE